jgi:hypothetical protein
MDIKVEELLKQMLNFFQNIDKEIEKTGKKLQQKDLEREDLLHYYENHKMDATKYCRIGKLLKQTQQERRTIKNELEKFREIKKFSTKYNNKMIQGDIIQLLKSLTTISKRQAEPIYTYRTNILYELEGRHEQVPQQENSNR